MRNFSAAETCVIPRTKYSVVALALISKRDVKRNRKYAG